MSETSENLKRAFESAKEALFLVAEAEHRIKMLTDNLKAISQLTGDKNDGTNDDKTS